MSDVPDKAPKVFISYSWTSDEHSEWVAELGARLMRNGVDVLLDQWSLEDGHDLHAFMEKMVSDPTIKRVIIISDAAYAAKADGRRGGVGKETQIISKEVYERAEQTKFVPVLRERDKDGNPCLPVYLGSRKYIDFSRPENEEDAYDQLLRNIFERPRRPKPTLGAPPTYIFGEDAPVFASVQKARRFRDCLTGGKGRPSAAFEDFADELLVDFEGLRMVYSNAEEGTWCERIKKNIEQATPLRDAFADALSVAASHLPGEEAVTMCVPLLEQLLQFRERPASGAMFFRCSEDNYKLLCYEFFLYAIAAFIKSRKFSEARQVIDHRYIVPRTCHGSELEDYSFTRFNSYAESLEQTCAQRGNQRRLSLMADLVHDRANNKRLRFNDVLQADVVLWLASKGDGWFPRCMVYGASAGKLALFVRAVDESGFAALAELLKLRTPAQLLQALSSDEIGRTFRSEIFFHSHPQGCLNLEELRRCWG